MSDFTLRMITSARHYVKEKTLFLGYFTMGFTTFVREFTMGMTLVKIVECK